MLCGAYHNHDEDCRLIRTSPALGQTLRLRSLTMSAPQANEAEKNIEIWKVKKLIKRLEAARGNGTSMISLIIPPKDQVSRAAKMLAEEFGTASNSTYILTRHPPPAHVG